MKSRVLSRFLLVALVAVASAGKKAGTAEETCPAKDLLGPGNGGDFRCCGSKFGKGKDIYVAACDTSSCVENFAAKNLNCFNYGSPQNSVGGKAGQGGSANCPYTTADKAICDVSAYEKANGVNCRDGEKGGKNHCLGVVKCGTQGIVSPKGKHSNGKAVGGEGVKCSSTAFPAGTTCFYNGYSENFKVCGAAGDDDIQAVNRSKKDRAAKEKSLRKANKAKKDKSKASKKNKRDARKKEGKELVEKKGSKRSGNKKKRTGAKLPKKGKRVKDVRAKAEKGADFVPGSCVAGHLCAEIRGDPHITTFDQVKYDCQGQGEFVAAKTLPGVSANEGFQIQTRFSSGANEFKGEGQITVLKAFSIDNGIDTVPIVQGMTSVNAATGECVIDYYLDGVDADWSTVLTSVVDFKRVGLGSSAVDYLYFPATGLMFTVSTKGSGSLGCRMNSKICLPQDFVDANKIVGLIGSPDGDDTNEWTDPSGKVVSAQAGDFKTEYQYCVNNWCAAEANSIFTYFTGVAYSDVSACTATYVPVIEDMLVKAPDGCSDACATLAAQFAIGDELERMTKEGDCRLECALGGVAMAVQDMADAELLQNVEKKCPDPEMVGDAAKKLKPKSVKKLKSKKNKERKNTKTRKATKLNKKAGTKKAGRTKERAADDFIPGQCVADHQCAEIRGDPHITSFDGQKYNCQGEGEFVAVATLAGSANDMFEIHTRFNSGIKEFVGEGGITVMKAITIENGVTGVPKFEAFTSFDDASQQCVIDYYLDGVEPDWTTIDSTVIDYQVQGLGSSAVHYIYFPSTGLMYTVSAKWGSFGCRMNSKICLPPDFINANKIVGLLGTPDGNTNNEWTSKTGAPVAKGTSMLSEYQYCTSTWCVAEPATMFTYFDGDTFAKFNNCQAAYDPAVENMLKTPTAECIEVCTALAGALNVGDRAAAYANCMLECAEDGVDGGITDMADAEILQDVQKKCADPEKVAVPTAAPVTAAPVTASKAPVTSAPVTKAPVTSAPATKAPASVAPAPPKETAPVEEPTEAVRTVKGAFGDPHVRTWSGEHYEYHGACDLVLVHNPEFGSGLGMDIHIRNKRVKYWSYIETAVLRIGGETLEVKGGENTNEFWVNGVLGNAASESGMLPETIAGFPIKFDWLSQGRRRFVVDLGNGEQVIFKTFKYFIRVNILAKQEDNFKSSAGLMGTYPEGKKVARDLVTVLEDYNVFGQEWQVLPGEAMLFHNVEGAQSPSKCELPIMSTQRRLAESTISLEDAEIACSRVSKDDRDACIFDVLATEDKDMAGAY